MTTPDPPPGVVITPREIYDAVRELTVRVDIVIAQHEQLASRAGDHEDRLRSLERARWPLPSIAAIMSVIAILLGAIPYFSS